MKSIIIFTALFTLTLAAHQFRVRNNCGFTLTAGIQGNSNHYTPENGGFTLGAGQQRSFSINDGWGGRIWPRRSSPSTLAEFRLDAYQGMDFYDVSHVDGFNLPVQIRLIAGTFRRTSNGKYDCNTAGCARDLNPGCPEQLRVYEGGRVVACKSSCTAFPYNDQYCCRGAYGQPSTCRPSTWAINSAGYFKQYCPDAYSYAFDDQTSTFTCHGNPRAGYEVVFCP